MQGLQEALKDIKNDISLQVRLFVLFFTKMFVYGLSALDQKLRQFTAMLLCPLFFLLQSSDSQTIRRYLEECGYCNGNGYKGAGPSLLNQQQIDFCSEEHDSCDKNADCILTKGGRAFICQVRNQSFTFPGCLRSVTFLQFLPAVRCNFYVTLSRFFLVF